LTEEDSAVVFSDRGYSVALHRPNVYPDGYGYRHRVDLEAGPFSGTIDATSYGSVVALARFREALSTLYRNLQGEASLEEDSFTLKLRGDGRGHIDVDVVAIGGPTMDARLAYTFRIDQTQLPTAIGLLQAYVG
jgi:hypothetical protein